MVSYRQGRDGADSPPLTCRGWARPQEDKLKGMILIHQGDDSEFVADRTEPARKD